MDNNGFDNRDDFYSGYDNNSQGSGGFYGGYDNNSQNGGGFYTGYDDNKEDTYADPFSGRSYSQNAGLSDAEINYNVIRAKGIVNYDNFGLDGTSMDAVQSMHPNAKYADASDARSRLTKMLIVAGVFLAVGLLFLSTYFSKDAEQTDMLKNSEQVQAQVQHILAGNKFPESVLGIKSYNVTYRYHYDTNYYGGMDELTLDQLHMVGLSNISSDEMGKYISVHVNKDDPKRSLLITENFIGRGFLFFFFFALIAAIFIVIGIKLYRDCMSGKTAVYTNEQGVKVYQKLK